MVAAQVLGLKPEQVRSRRVLAGGSFGRRATPDADMAAEAATVPKAAKHQGADQDDMERARTTSAAAATGRCSCIGCAARSDPDGTSRAWEQAAAGQSFMFGTPFEQAMVKNGLDETMIEGASDMPYAIPNLRVSVHREEVGVPTLWWRSVGHTHTAFAMETFIDELAASARIDELELRRKLLAKEPRHLGVLDLVAEKSGWGHRRCPRVARAASPCTNPSAPMSPRSPRSAAARRGCPRSKGLVRGRLRPADQSRRHRARRCRAASATACPAPLFSAIDLDGRQGRAVELQHVPLVAHSRDAGGRGAHRAVDREAHGRRRAGRAADRAGRRAMPGPS